MDLVRQLEDYIHPRLSFIYIDDLPLYFRDYYGKRRLHTQNMRGYGYCLAMLSRLAEHILVLYSTYANALNPSEPIYFSHSCYYSLATYRLSGSPSKMELQKIA